jgi:hypothetical protein
MSAPVPAAWCLKLALFLLRMFVGWRLRHKVKSDTPPDVCSRPSSSHGAAGRKRDSKKSWPRSGLCSELSRCLLAFRLCLRRRRCRRTARAAA